MHSTMRLRTTAPSSTTRKLPICDKSSTLKSTPRPSSFAPVRCQGASNSDSAAQSGSSGPADDAVSMTFRRGEAPSSAGRTPSAATRQLEEAWLDGRGRIGMMVMANKGTLDQAPTFVKREDTPGKLLSEIIHWPSWYSFTVVGRAGLEADTFMRDMVAVVAGLCGKQPADVQCRVTERMGGKFVSIQMLAMVPGPDNVASVFEALGQDPRVKMKF